MTTGSWRAGVMAALRPPPRLSLSEWADRHFALSPESSANEGRWRTRPYQRGILDAITDPSVERVSVMKSARVGYTKMINAAVAYYMSHDPCSIMVVQPTVDDAKGYSKEEIAPMLRDLEVLQGVVSESRSRDSDATILHKRFPGGVLGMVGANSGTGFRRVSRRVVIFDEVDGYPASAGDEGDPIALGENRAQDYWNRKIISGSTPKIADASRIEELFLAGDRRRFYVPCSQCGHMDFLRFRRRDGDGDGRGHRMRWPEGRPKEACFECSANGCVIEETSKRAMVAAGEWRAEREFDGHASFHIWSAYSTAPHAGWGDIAAAWVAAKRDTAKLQAVVNTILGETWKERGEAPDWERLHERSEPYPIGTVPDARALALTAGVDVQQNRLVYEVVAWAANKESWSIDYGEILGDTALDATWLKLEERVLHRQYPGPEGAVMPVAMMAVDSGFRASIVYAWARKHPLSRVIAVKGVPGSRALIGVASAVDVTVSGKRIQRGYRMFPVSGDIVKSELYAWLKLRINADGVPAGYCHFPEHPEEYFRQLTAEQLVKVANRKTNRIEMHWEQIPNRENHALDARVYARAAAALLGIDRIAQPPRAVTNTDTRAVVPVDGAGRQPSASSRARPGGNSAVDRFATRRPWFGRRR